jgi:hypothetical protein
VKPYSNGQHDDARGKMESFTKNRLAFVQCELERGARSGCEEAVPEAERFEGPRARPVGH